MSEVSPMQRFVGAILMAVGGLIVGLCGLCTGTTEIFLLYGAWREWLDGRNPGGSILFAMGLSLMSGVIPIIIGLGVFFWGRNLLRTGDRK